MTSDRKTIKIGSPQSTANNNRGMAYISETLIGILFLSGVIFFSLTQLPISEPFLSLDDREQQAEMQQDLDQFVETANKDGSLKASILNWDEDNARYASTKTLQNGEGLYLDYPADEFGDKLVKMVDRYNGGQAAIQIQPTGKNSSANSLEYSQEDSIQFLSVGSAGNTMVVSETTLVLYDTDRLKSPPKSFQSSNPQSLNDSGDTKLEDSDTYPIEPSTNDPDDGIYNVVDVRVIVWF